MVTLQGEIRPLWLKICHLVETMWDRLRAQRIE
jgi:hypothetical protein